MEKMNIYDTANQLYQLVVGHLTNSSSSSNPQELYLDLRYKLLSNPLSSSDLPPIIRGCNDIDECWKIVSSSYATYKERRTFLWEEFSPLLNKLASISEAPLDELVTESLNSNDYMGIQAIWMKALQRRSSDPEGAITVARSLLESTCKHILDDLGVEYSPTAKLPALYRLVAIHLSLAPDQYPEQVFKQILGGAQSVVEGLGSVRNKLSDAHGQGKRPVKPSERHAELAVNIAGSIASFLVRTHQERKRSA